MNTTAITPSDMKALYEEHEDYLDCGGQYDFKGFLRHHHYHIYLKLYS